MLKRYLLEALLLLGICANIAFLAINLSPDRPHLARRRQMKLLLRASPWRGDWMQENLLAEFGKARDVDFKLVLAKDFDEVVAHLREEAQHPSGMLLADLNDESSDLSREEHLVRPFEGVVAKEELTATFDEYTDEARKRATADGKTWYLPKRALVDVVAFLKPAVEDAFVHWEEDRPQIEAALREANGHGLPANYELEKTPSKWDSYDLFVAAWYWAHHPAPWAESSLTLPPGAPTTAPRVVLRTGDNDAGLEDLLGSFYRHGLKDEEVGKFDSPAVIDALQWLALFHKHHLLAKESERAGGLDAFGANDLMKDRKVAWMPIDQADSLWLHGGSRRNAPSGMVGALDLDWTTFPTGSSLALKDGKPLREGPSFAFEEIHFWALPSHAPDARLAFELARFLTQKGLQQRETEAVGMLPIRQDIADDYPILFRLNWMQRMLDASYRQLAVGSGDLPDEVYGKHLDETYARIERAIFERPVAAPVDEASIRKLVDAARKEAPRGN